MAWQAVIRPRLSLPLQKGPCCLMRQLAVPGEGAWGLPSREGSCIMMAEYD